MTVQDVKDSFYLGLRDAIAAGNPARTAVIRGVSRPAVLVTENELPHTGEGPLETFRLTWSGLKYQPDDLITVACQIEFSVNGGDGVTETGSSVLGRGRALAAMDAELISALDVRVRSFAGLTSAEVNGVTSRVATGTQVFWGQLSFSSAVSTADRMNRAVSLEVFGYGN